MAASSPTATPLLMIFDSFVRPFAHDAQLRLQVPASHEQVIYPTSARVANDGSFSCRFVHEKNTSTQLCPSRSQRVCLRVSFSPLIRNKDTFERTNARAKSEKYVLCARTRHSSSTYKAEEQHLIIRSTRLT